MNDPNCSLESALSEKVKVVTYNIRHGRGIDEQVDLERVAETLKAANADIICLQEVDWRNPRSGNVNQANVLGRRLGYHSYYRNSYSAGLFLGFGNAILSRDPIYSTWNKHLPSLGEPRCLLHATVAGLHGPLSVLCTHWGLNAAHRVRQAEATAQIIADSLADIDPDDVTKTTPPRAIILCGDFNANLGSPELRRLLQLSHFQAAGRDQQFLTYRSDNPTARIDHILTSSGAECTSIAPVDSLASDHKPLLATLTLDKWSK